MTNDNASVETRRIRGYEINFLCGTFSRILPAVHSYLRNWDFDEQLNFPYRLSIIQAYNPYN